MRQLTAGGEPGQRKASGWPQPEKAGRRVTVAVLAVAVLLGGAACASSSSAGTAKAPGTAQATGTPGTSCGTARTAAGVAVRIDVVKGTVNCATAARVEAGYAAAIEDGELHGNGGGAPVAVDGWTCESYSAVQAARTADASECHTANAEVVAVLSASSGSAPGSTGS